MSPKPRAELSPDPTLAEASNTGVEESNATTLILSSQTSQTNKRVFYNNSDQEFVYRDSSVPTSHFSSTVPGTRSSSRFHDSRAGDCSPRSPNDRAQVAMDEVDEKAHAQQSTKPISADSDHHDTSRPSSPASVHQDAPLTRARARARAQTLNIPCRDEGNDSIQMDYDVEKPNSKIGNGGVHISPPTACRALPEDEIRQDAESQCIDGLRGYIKNNSPTMGRNSASTAHQTECSGSNSGDDDDEYELPDSENGDSDFEESVIREIRGGPRKKTNKITPKITCSSKSITERAQEKAIPNTAKTVGGRTTKKASVSKKNYRAVPKQAPDPPVIHGISPNKPKPSCQGAEPPMVTTPEEALQYIPFPSDPMKASRDIGSPTKAKAKLPNIRRPKRPFYEAGVSVQQRKVGPNSHRQRMVNRGKAESLSPNEPKPRVEPTFQSPAQDESFDFDTPQSDAEQRNNYGSVENIADRKKDYDTANSGLNLTASRVYKSPSMSPPNMRSSLTDIKHETVCTQVILSNHMDTQNSQIFVNSKPGKILVKNSQTSVVEDPFNDADVCSRASPPSFGPKSACVHREMDTRNGATQTELLDFQPSIRNGHREAEHHKGESSSNAAAYLILGSPLEHNDTGWPRQGDHSPIKPKNGLEMEEDLGNFQIPVDHPRHLNREESLHPSSKVWAEQIAEESRQKKLSSVPQLIARGKGSPDRTPEDLQGHVESPTSRREIALRGRRDAIFQSVQEITATVLQHLQTKESAVDDVKGLYRQKGYKLIRILVDNQLVEFRQTATAFDDRCTKLESLFAKSARIIKTVNRRMSNENSRHSRDWARRKREIGEAIKMAKEAAASLSDSSSKKFPRL